ncbi:aminopeptidase [Crepidotus variabilis]|uniref:Peptide hydrolase n=1 Tax=Crepidotus variabilis TaxID=179855 RepID=A0A9P6JW38_9AGAR|nr:aminopeptidase [Crepidotus variabilis]
MKFSLGFALLIQGSLALALAARQQQITSQEIQEKTSQGLRLLSLSETTAPVWKTEDEKLELLRKHTRFFDVTEVYDPQEALVVENQGGKNLKSLVSYPKPSHQSQVLPLIQTASLSEMQGYLANLTAFNNRYYKATTGQQASTWIRDTVAGIIAQYPTSGASVQLFTHTWVQSSIIATIPGTSATTPITILGGHMDSINLSNPTSGRAPGADDDGSGAVNLLEAFRVLLAGGFKPSTPVEFHWYSGEEGGLLGSQAIAKSYNSKGAKVKAMLQFDMTAYVKPGTKAVAGLMPDYTDSGLTTFVSSLIEAYTKLAWVINDPCGYACSDHASWNKYGYPTALPFESLFNNDNPQIHSSGDTISVAGFNWTHTFEFAKLATAFAYELGA